MLSYVMKDLPATKDALDVLQGNYSPRVIGDPSFFSGSLNLGGKSAN